MQLVGKNGRHTIALAFVIATFIGVWILNQAPLGSAQSKSIDQILAGMTVEEKVGQLVMAGIPSHEITPEAHTLIEKLHLGGIILSVRNIKDTRQTANLTASLQEMAIKSGAGIPLLISADQEGGYVVRLRGVASFPGNMAMGATGSPDLMRRVARAMGRELRSVGINVNFAPVLDVNSNPDNPVIGVRSFGENPELVAQMGNAYIAGMHEAGVLATAKHFPGHGDTAKDSHTSLPIVQHPRGRLDKVELYPFREAIRSGVDAIMTAHVAFPTIEPTVGLPATLSTRVLTGLLRNELGFGGLIVTDSMNMAGVTANYSLTDAVVMAIQAGADIVLMAAGWNDASKVVEALANAVRTGAISESRLDTSVRRVLAAKEKLGLWNGGAQSKPLSLEEQTEQHNVSWEAATKSVTLVRDLKSRLPLGKQSGKVLVIMASTGTITGAEEAAVPRGPLGTSLRKYVPAVSEITCSNKPDKATRSKIVAQAAGYDTVVMATYYAWSSAYTGQASLVEELRAAGKEPIVVSLREPYDLMRFPNISTYLAAYTANSESMEAVAQILAGERAAVGRLPVSIPKLHAAGW